MTELVCASCARDFTVRPQTPRQTFCPAPECQRERRRRWAKAKLTADPDYRANQLAAQRGLESGTTPPKVLVTVAEIRKESQIPIVLYVYFNILHKRGLKQFIADIHEP